MRIIAVFVLLLAVSTIPNASSGQSRAPDNPPLAWDQGSIALWCDRFLPELDSLAAFAGRKNPESDSPADKQLRHERAGALKAIGSIESVLGSVRTQDIVDKNLTFYSRLVIATEGRYALTDWPGADALVRMGSRAYPAIFNRMNDACDELEIRVLAQIIINIDGRELAAHRLKIRQRDYRKEFGQPGNEDDRWKNHVRVLAILEDPEYSDEKYSPTAYYKANMK